LTACYQGICEGKRCVCAKAVECTARTT